MEQQELQAITINPFLGTWQRIFGIPSGWPDTVYNAAISTNVFCVGNRRNYRTTIPISLSQHVSKTRDGVELKIELDFELDFGSIYKGSKKARKLGAYLELIFGFIPGLVNISPLPQHTKLPTGNNKAPLTLPLRWYTTISTECLIQRTTMHRQLGTGTADIPPKFRQPPKASRQPTRAPLNRLPLTRLRTCLPFLLPTGPTWPETPLLWPLRKDKQLQQQVFLFFHGLASNWV